MTSAIYERLHQLITQSRSTQVGIAAHQLVSCEEILINEDLPFHAASTIKLCVMMETFHQARGGRFSLDDPITIRNQFTSIADGSTYELVSEDDSEKDLYHRIGETCSRRELVWRMITSSSNLATNLLVEQVRPEEINAFMQDLGAGSLITRRGVEDKAAYRLGMNNSVTARGLMQVLLKLAKGEVVSPEDSDEMRRILSDQQLNEMIPAGLPFDAHVAHKTGSAADYFHDAGIVYPTRGEAFVLAILTKGYPESDEDAAHAFVASLARAVYEYWNQEK